MKRPDSRSWFATVAGIIFLLADNLPYLMKWLNLRAFWPSMAVLGLRNLLEILMCAAGIFIAHGFGLARALRELGLRAPVKRALVFALIASLPMFTAFALTCKINVQMTFLTVGVGCLIAPLAEEILYRGFLFRQLYRRARVGFWVSALIPSIIFAVAHFYQSNDFWELVGISAITGLGSILSCWIFLRWQDNVWAIFGLHALMNLWWEVFAVDDTALGGWLANAARLATVALAVILTIYKDRIWKPLPAEEENVRLTQPAANDKNPPDEIAVFAI